MNMRLKLERSALDSLLPCPPAQRAQSGRSCCTMFQEDSAVIAPTARQLSGRQPPASYLPLMPRRQAAPRRIPVPPGRRRAIAPQRNGPSPGAPGWLAVGKAGDRNARSAPARAARRMIGDAVGRTGHHAARPQRSRPTPAAQMHPGAEGSRQPRDHPPPPAPGGASGRSVPGPGRAQPAPGSESCLSTTPARARGRAATAARGSGRRRSSVNSQRRGSRGAVPRIARSRGGAHIRGHDGTLLHPPWLPTCRARA